MTYATEKATEISGSGKVTLPAYCMLALTLIGIAAALYVAKGNYTGQPLWCPVIDGCNTVVNSTYSRVFGVPMCSPRGNAKEAGVGNVGNIEESHRSLVA